jgi:DNA repair exonuclease SbcCD ATPase subunit
MFNSTISQLNSQIETSQNTIAQLEAQLQQEREALTQLETHRQAFTTAASAAQSAKEQVMVAIQLLGTVAPDNLAEFQSELNALFDAYPKSILAETSTNTDSQEQSEKDADAFVNDQPIVEVEVIPSMDNESTNDEDVATADDFITHLEELPLSYKDLMQEDYEVLKAIANDMNLPNGSKGKVCSGLTKQKITRSTILAKLAEFRADIGG